MACFNCNAPPLSILVLLTALFKDLEEPLAKAHASSSETTACVQASYIEKILWGAFRWRVRCCSSVMVAV